MAVQTSLLSKVFSFITHFENRFQLGRKLPLVLSFAALVLGIVTYIALTRVEPLHEKADWLVPLIYTDLLLLLFLAIFIAKRLVELWLERRRGLIGSKLHIQIVMLFSFVAVVPAIFVAVFSALFFNVGVKAWFSEPVRLAINEASAVAEAYVNEHKNAIKQDASVMVMELRPHVPALVQDTKVFAKILSQMSDAFGLDEALVFSGSQQVVARSYLTFALEFEKILFHAFDAAKVGEIVIMPSEAKDRVRAILKLDPLTDTYLYIGKKIDPSVLKHYQQTQGAVAEYRHLEQERSSLQITFVIFFSLISLLLLLSAIWVGLYLANILIHPIRRLILASEEVALGNLHVRVEEYHLNNEIDNLTRTFNYMTAQLNSQHQDLVQANLMADRRRQFTENVLASVSAGVIGLNHNQEIHLANEKAHTLLGCINLKGLFLEQVVPEFQTLIKEASAHEPHIQQITLIRRGVHKILQVCVVVEKDDIKKAGFVITFDDITPLINAQRKAAWSDVARKIAHEIKNPLTPIQLSAERLKRRFLKEITSDSETFQTCINTIIRQVSHIGKLVSEFSSFARMPEPILVKENLTKLCQEAFVLQKNAYPNIEFYFNHPDQDIFLDCDHNQITQVLTNLLQNAIDALTSFYDLENNELDKIPKIWLRLQEDEKTVTLSVEDNGPGLPKEGRERLTEPYFTTRTKGTGLGLAIVTKIVEDHRGHFELGNSHYGGARVTLIFNHGCPK
ncbi:MAG: PAS domain-containing sensor histidine kinase [Proteobacteria bacterium]|nr:PAS domain-containing sensor histidine kinase [Pseudomonadota bacterium]